MFSIKIDSKIKTLKIYKKNYDAILSKYDLAEKRYINYAYVLLRLIFLFILKVANIRCFILIAVEIVHNIIRI